MPDDRLSRKETKEFKKYYYALVDRYEQTTYYLQGMQARTPKEDREILERD